MIRQILFLSAIILHESNALASSSNNNNNSNDKTHECAATTFDNSIIHNDVEALRLAVSSGRVYQVKNFLSEPEVQSLVDDIQQLEDSGQFKPSGLSNTALNREQNKFGQQDRTTCPVPWWNDGGGGGKHPDSVAAAAASKIMRLREFLSEALNRPTMKQPDLSHECYYSKSMKGSFLPRHMDERHEEMKGAKGWLLPSRRSVSWLLYVSDEDDTWTLEEHGGALRTFRQPTTRADQESTHQGNLQVGWLLPPETTTTTSEGQQQQAPSEAVYMDSWFPFETPDGRKEPFCILYTTTTTVSDDSKGGEEELTYVSKPWSNDVLQGMASADFIKQYQQELFVSEEYADRFVLIEDRQEWDSSGDDTAPRGTIVEDTVPLRGSLVVFDSVLVPHQVETIKKGTRLALAGWFHEATQPFPENVYS